MKRQHYYFYIPQTREYDKSGTSRFSLEAFYIEKCLNNPKLSIFRYFDKVDYEINFVGNTISHKVNVITGEDACLYHAASSLNELEGHFEKIGGRQISKKEYLKNRKLATQISPLNSIETLINRLTILLFTAGIVYTMVCVYMFKIMN